MNTPKHFTLNAYAYDSLLATTKWYEDMPKCLDGELSDRFHETIAEQKNKMFDEGVEEDIKALSNDSEDWFVIDFETTDEGNVVAIVIDNSDESGEVEIRVPVVRGDE